MKRLICTRQTMPDALADTIFSDRGHQFVQRLRWDLCVTPQGYEVDEYDDENSSYLTVHRQGNHIGSCRVRPTCYRTMLTDHFLASFPEAHQFLDMQKGRVYELTRFCRSPDISVPESKEMLGHLATLLDEFRDRGNLTGFVAVVFPHVARFLDTIGVRYLLLSKSKISNKPAYMICITHAERVGNSSGHGKFGTVEQCLAA